MGINSWKVGGVYRRTRERVWCVHIYGLET